MFKESLCDFCGECLGRCPYIDFDTEQGALEFKRLVKGDAPDWLKQCVTCFACNEYCPRDARPFDIIVKRMEERGDYIDPKLFTLARDMVIPKKDFTPPELTGPVMSLCTIYVNMPWAFQGQLFEGLNMVKGRHYFCNLLYPHLGNETLLREGMQPLVDRLASLGAQEIIFIHDDCYSVMTEYASQYKIDLPFRPVHIFEYLLKYLQNHKDIIVPLNMNVAYQRPCASRLTPEKDSMLDEIFDLIGVTRVARKYDRENALCCGQDMHGMQSRGEKFPQYQDLNIQDALDHQARAMIFLCPLCLDALYKKSREAGLQNYMISDLCRLALGEELPEDAYLNLE